MGEALEAPLAKLASPETAPRRLQLGARLRNYFLTGLIIVGPLAITVNIVWWFVNLVDAWVKPLMPDLLDWIRRYLPEGYSLPSGLQDQIPGIGLLFAIIGLTVIGALTANLLGRTIVSYGEMMLNRMPVVRNVYNGLKQIFETVLSQSGSSFQKVALVEFPRKGMWSIVFIAGESKGEVDARLGTGEPTVCAFLPCTPNPTTGYLIYVPRNEVIELDMKIEDAAKLVISAGLITPEFNGALDKTGVEKLAAEGRLRGQQAPGS
ncbi:MAG: DUF502 domain-containing protein [Hyphomicrobiaceae bacterium]